VISVRRLLVDGRERRRWTVLDVRRRFDQYPAEHVVTHPSHVAIRSLVAGVDDVRCIIGGCRAASTMSRTSRRTLGEVVTSTDDEDEHTNDDRHQDDGHYDEGTYNDRHHRPACVHQSVTQVSRITNHA